MKFWRRVLEDLVRGENIDLYATVLLAFVAAAINVFGVAPQGLITSLGIAAIALIASAILGNRYRIEDIQKYIRQDLSNKILREFPDTIDKDVANASEFWYIGVNATVTLRNYRSLFEEKARAGRKLHFLLVDPKGSACAMSAARSPGKPYVDREKINIISNLDDLCEIRKLSPSNVKVRVIDDPLAYGGFVINPDQPEGVMYILRYSYQAVIRPKFVFRPGDEWYNFTRAEINSLWERGVDWDCNSEGTA
jgi:hypothetical protein